MRGPIRTAPRQPRQTQKLLSNEILTISIADGLAHSASPGADFEPVTRPRRAQSAGGFVPAATTPACTQRGSRRPRTRGGSPEMTVGGVKPPNILDRG